MRQLKLIALAMLLAAAFGCVNRFSWESSNIKVAGGEIVQKEEAIARSSVAVFFWFSQHDKTLTYRCSGTLISSKAVLTAAHCMRAWPDGGYQVVFDSEIGKETIKVENLSDYKHVYQIKKENIKNHPTYDEDEYDSPDLALLLLDSPAPDTHRPVSIAAETLAVKEAAPVTIAAFGPTDRNDEDHGILRRITIPYIGPDPKAPSGSRLLLQGVPGTPGSTACPGDSGGSAYLDIEGEPVLLGVLTGGRHGCLSREVGDNINVVQDLRKEWTWLRNEVKDIAP